MDRVLIITYYWPPAGGSAVQRWLHFCKHLPKYGWESIVYIPENARYQQYDYSLDIPNVTILSYPIIEPIKFYEKFTGNKIGVDMSSKELYGLSKIKHNISWWIRSNLFIPDAHFLWIKPSVKYLTKYLKDNPVSTIITSGPPHSVHMIGYKLKKKLGVRWIADFRDPWTNIDFYNKLNMTSWANKIHHRLEKKVLSTADHIITVSNTMKQEFNQSNVTTITNGYDPEDFHVETNFDKKFSIVYTGTLSSSRNCIALWKALSNLPDHVKENLEIKLIGEVDSAVMQYIRQYDLLPYITYFEFLSHKETIRMMQKAWVLLLIINESPNANGIITRKIFEYMATSTPILLIGPQNGDAAKIVKNALVVKFDDEEDIRLSLNVFYLWYENNHRNIPGNSILKYSTDKLTKKLVKLL